MELSRYYLANMQVSICDSQLAALVTLDPIRHDHAWYAFGVFETFQPSLNGGVQAEWITLDH